MKLKHKRDAIYGFLDAVFRLVMECRERKQLKKLKRCPPAVTVATF